MARANTRGRKADMRRVIYCGPSPEVWTPDGLRFPQAEAVYVPARLAESLLEQDTFTDVLTDRNDEDGQGTEAD